MRRLSDAKSARPIRFVAMTHATTGPDHVGGTGLTDKLGWIQLNDARTKAGLRYKSEGKYRSSQIPQLAN